jgi:acyl-coenzyme A synthetase/AMP-(fatty) acid ligase
MCQLNSLLVDPPAHSNLKTLQGMQVAPAELEAHLLGHPAVADVAVIPVQDDRAGELPRAIVSISAHFMSEDRSALARKLQKYVEAHKARHKWLHGGVGFIDTIPKSPSGKILRRHLRDQEDKRRRIPRASI